MVAIKKQGPFNYYQDIFIVYLEPVLKEIK